MGVDSGQPRGMADIAAAAGVAVSTVSRALSGAPGVSQAKRAEILTLAREMGYVVSGDSISATRRGLRGRIVAVIPEPDRWVFGSILAGLHDVLTPSTASFSVYQGFSGGERSKIFSSLPQRADVVIVAPMPLGLSAADIERIGVPVIVAGTLVDGLRSVGIDDVEVGQKATNYLINIGYRRIAYAYYTDHDGMPGSAGAHRGHGFGLSMERAGLDPDWRIQVPWGASVGRDAAEMLLAGNSLPEAIVAASDEMAAGMMAVFRAVGVRVPEDIAIIGVDDHPIAELMRLTTIAQPAREQGRIAATMALQLLSGLGETESRAVSTRLIVRDSTAKREQR